MNDSDDLMGGEENEEQKRGTYVNSEGEWPIGNAVRGKEVKIDTCIDTKRANGRVWPLPRDRR